MSSLTQKIYLALPGLRNGAATIKGLLVNRERYGSHYEEALDRIEARAGWTAETMRDYQASRLRELAGIAARHVPYYRELFRKLGLSPDDVRCPDDLRKLPILEKDLVRANPLQFVDERLNPRRLLSETTTGTTGTPIRVLMTPAVLQEHYAFFEARCRRETGFRYGRDPFVTFGARRVAAMNRTTPPFWCYNHAGRQLYMSVYHLAPCYLVYYCIELTRRPYRLVMGYPSAIAALARYVMEEGVDWIRIPLAITSGETLHPEQRQVIERAFRCRVFDQYGCAELSVLAAEGRCGSLHLSPDYGITEVVDDRGEPVPDGTPGHVVCTGLVNSAQILLRYRIGDTGALAARPCGCRSALPVLRGLEGRSVNAILLPDGRKLYRMASVAGEIPAIRGYQIVQEEVGRFTLYVVPAEGYRNADGSWAARNLGASVGPAAIRVECVSEIPRGPGGKFASVVSRVTAANPEKARAAGAP
jgi:phenylacetate-CoA ligase